MRRNGRRLAIGMMVTLLLAAGLSLTGVQAYALDIDTPRNAGERVLALSGRFLQNEAERVAAVLRAVGPFDVVTFDSTGGSVRGAIEVGELLRREGLATRIESGRTCSSACLFAFAGGRHRQVERGGRVGVHRATLTGNEERIAAVVAAARSGDHGAVVRAIGRFEQASTAAATAQMQHLNDMGISVRLMALHVEVDHDAMHWLTPEELRSFAVVNALED